MDRSDRDVSCAPTTGNMKKPEYWCVFIDHMNFDIALQKYYKSLNKPTIKLDYNKLFRNVCTQISNVDFLKGFIFVPNGYLIPDLRLPTEEEQPIGTWGQQHLDYLKQYRKVTYTNLLTSGKLNTYLGDINRQAQERFEKLIEGFETGTGHNGTAYFVFQMVKTSVISHKRFKLL